jgi:adenine-specific DNA-methyltransferase
VFHQQNQGLPSLLAKGLALFLNSTAVDAYFRQFSGHTQVNARDLRSLRFPDDQTLRRLGRHVSGHMPTTDEINRLVREEISSMSEGDDPIAGKTKVESAIGVLKALKAPKEQRNERSALTLLALLDLDPSARWAKSSNPRRGVTEIMDWMAAKYGKKYAPNTRETVRRFTLHQFVEMGLVLLNPDNPQRPTNSPKNVYQIEPSALELLRTFGTDDWQENLTEYLDSMEGKNRLRETARRMTQIPVTLPSGETLQLSAGGQNVLIKEIIEQFAPRFTPGGHVVYVGDAGDKHLLNDESYLRTLGVVIDRHGKMPDVVIHYKQRNWLVLVEAVTSHGPVNMLRHTQLKDLFAASTAGLVFVTAFLDRQAMREYLPDIAWETEVWVADAPSHLIHFNGERFLGPYEQ